MGKHKYIETPGKMWELFEAYRNDVKDNPRLIHDYVGKDGTHVTKPLERPLTIEGFKTYCYDNGLTLDHYIKNTDNAYEEYRPIITRIREAIRHDQIEGGLVGQYNSNLTARLNGLVEKTQNENVQKVELFKGIDLSVKEDNSAD